MNNKKWVCTIQKQGFCTNSNFCIAGGALKLLAPSDNFVNNQILHCVNYVLSTQDGITGGLAKWPENMPDPMHTYLGLAGLSIASYSDLLPVDPELNITKRARAFLTTLYNKS